MLLPLPSRTFADVGLDLMLLLLPRRTVADVGLDLVLLLLLWRTVRDMGIRLVMNPGAASRLNPSDVSIGACRGRFLVNSVQNW
jgi:hypothetical protein